MLNLKVPCGVNKDKATRQLVAGRQATAIVALVLAAGLVVVGGLVAALAPDVAGRLVGGLVVATAAPFALLTKPNVDPLGDLDDDDGDDDVPPPPAGAVGVTG